MTDEATKTTEAAAAPKGLPPGVTSADLNDGESAAGAPKPAEIVNTPPAKEPTAEEKAAADAAKAAEAVAAEAAEKERLAAVEAAKQAELDAEDYVTYDNPTAEAIVTTLKEAGVTTKEADTFFRTAIEANDMSKIDMAGLTAKVGKEKAILIAAAIKDYYTTEFAAVQETVKAVYTEVGGEANWLKVQAWAQKLAAADPEFAKKVQSYNKMLDLDKTSAVMATKALVADYNADKNNKSLTVTIVHGDKSASGGLGEAPLSRDEYLAKVKAAHDKGDVAEVNRLRAARTASRQAVR